MPSIHSDEFGQVTFEAPEIYLFPEGLPGFEDSKEYLLLQREGFAPFCFLQSVGDGALRFICLPARVVDPAFCVDVGAEDASELEIAAGCYGSADSEVEVLAILTIPKGGPATANLFAPIVLAPATRRGRQCIQFGTSAAAAHAITWMVQPELRVVA